MQRLARLRWCRASRGSVLTGLIWILGVAHGGAQAPDAPSDAWLEAATVAFESGAFEQAAAELGRATPTTRVQLEELARLRARTAHASGDTAARSAALRVLCTMGTELGSVRPSLRAAQDDSCDQPPASLRAEAERAGARVRVRATSVGGNGLVELVVHYHDERGRPRSMAAAELDVPWPAGSAFSYWVTGRIEGVEVLSLAGPENPRRLQAVPATVVRRPAPPRGRLGRILGVVAGVVVLGAAVGIGVRVGRANRDSQPSPPMPL